MSKIIFAILSVACIASAQGDQNDGKCNFANISRLIESNLVSSRDNGNSTSQTPSRLTTYTMLDTEIEKCKTEPDFKLKIREGKIRLKSDLYFMDSMKSMDDNKYDKEIVVVSGLVQKIEDAENEIFRNACKSNAIYDEIRKFTTSIEQGVTNNQFKKISKEKSNIYHTLDRCVSEKKKTNTGELEFAVTIKEVEKALRDYQSVFNSSLMVDVKLKERKSEIITDLIQKVENFGDKLSEKKVTCDFEQINRDVMSFTNKLLLTPVVAEITTRASDPEDEDDTGKANTGKVDADKAAANKVIDSLEQCTEIKENEKPIYLATLTKNRKRLDDYRINITFFRPGAKDKAELLTMLIAEFEKKEMEFNEKADPWGSDFRKTFYLGYESASVSGLNSQGTSRIGFMAYNQLPKIYSENSQKTKNIHIFGNVVLTSTGEETKTASASGEQEPSASTTPAEIESSIEVEAGLYNPRRGYKQTNGYFSVGPIISLRLRRTDETSNFTQINMIGLRLAHSPESYFDILYGKTSDIRGRRAEFRGQIPVTEVLSGNIYVGGSINIGVKDAPPDVDSQKLYITYQVKFDEILSRK